jgi:hypothetical protein
MAWKNLKQLSLADTLTSEHEALAVLDDVNEMIDCKLLNTSCVAFMPNVVVIRHGHLCLCLRRYYCRAGTT